MESTCVALGFYSSWAHFSPGLFKTAEERVHREMNSFRLSSKEGEMWQQLDR